MKKSILTLIALLIITVVTLAQEAAPAKVDTSAKADTAITDNKVPKDTSWTKGGNFGLNVAQSSFNNWQAGGENNISTTALLSVFANKKKENYTWDNTLDLAYGLLRQGNEGQVFKTDDKIDFSSKYGKKAVKKWYYSALINFKSQFSEGVENPTAAVKKRISDFMAPAYLIVAIGMDYKHNKYFSVFISPLTSKTTFVLDQTFANAGAYGVEAATYDPATGLLLTEGENVLYQMGAYLKAEYKKDIMENVNLGTKLDLFSNYLEKPENIDISWELLLAMKVNKYITSSISTHLIYDHDQITETQFKEVIAVGFSYKFN